MRMERRLDKEMQIIVPPPNRFRMTGITDPLNAVFAGTLHPEPCSASVIAVGPCI